MTTKKAEEHDNGTTVFMRITNEDIYKKIIDLENKVEDAIVGNKNNSKMIKWIWSVIGTIILTFISFLFIFIKG